MSGAVSSQFFSSILLCAPLFEGGLEVQVEGEQISPSYIDMTIHGMKKFGVIVENRQYRRYSVVPGQKYAPTSLPVEPDMSGASYFWGLAPVTRGVVRVNGLALDSVQGDIRFPELLETMGATVRRGTSGSGGFIEVECPIGNTLSGITCDMWAMPDTAQTLAVVAACVEGTTRINGLSTLRVKETDRIQALRTELSKVGIRTDSGEDWISVLGGNPEFARIATYDDHRMAMSFALLGARGPGIEIEHPGVTSKSFPDFWDRLKALGIGVEVAI
jgi:3-phosphoshikimate 1-carboxyvinyltransferase